MVTIREINASQTWDLRHHVMWPDQTIDYVKLAEDEDGTHFGLFEDDQLMSVVSLFINGQQAQFRKFATANAAQGRGYGTKLLNHLMAAALRYNVTTIWCNARSDKAAFYKRFGMIETDRKFIKEGLGYITMQKTIIP
ncbi:GNAT family acetyltransferase [Pedobacter lusitanus]|uniref:GNAT family acetyltransferase n=1 Tax=Pedobacter lusitanus TaxID=1503925 RepID=A0A0D0F7S7_9SPHI|nr:GNAT family N-acetyltransferase [Pedobacter lusitanus]KIO77708.1 GNAT family acetyltransferase [Pedobacter lusitanus]